MPNSLRAKLSKLRYKGEITQEEYAELIKKLDGHDAELLKAKEEVIDQFKWERDVAISQLEDIGASFGLDMKLWLKEHDTDLLDKVAEKIKEYSGLHCVDCDGYFDGEKELIFKVDDWIDEIIKEMKAEVSKWTDIG